ncbi:MAG: hypothetical protein Q9169_008228, partial [Polycauliona sp. 2 TL-2023]
MNKLTSIDIAVDGKSAVLGGGVFTDLLLETLAREGKVAGKQPGAVDALVQRVQALEEDLACKRPLKVHHRLQYAYNEFPSYQGYAGLMGDNFVEMDVVTANGSEIFVSGSSNPDLFWAMRGAGQNFGIVTKFRYKIFDYPKGPNIFHATYHFTEGKLEILFEHLNRLLDHGSLPVDPVFVYHLYYFGTPEEAFPYTQQILDLGPIFISNATFPYKEVSHRSFQASVGDPTCAAGISTKSRFPVGLKTYNVSTNRKIYNLFEEMITTTPALATGFVQFEAFPTQAVKAVDPASTAYAHRHDDILVHETKWYNSSAANAAAAIKYGRKARQLFVEGAHPMRLNAYSNYANGDETLEEIYGYEPWRLEKLRRLKREWDPHG